MRNKKKIGYLLSMIFVFSFSSVLFVWVLLAPLDSFKARRTGINFTPAEALYAKICGSCLLISISIYSAFKVYELYAKVQVMKFGPKMKTLKKNMEAFVSAVFVFCITALISYKFFALVWPYSTKDLIVGSLVTNLASILGLLIGGLLAIRSFYSLLLSKKVN